MFLASECCGTSDKFWVAMNGDPRFSGNPVDYKIIANNNYGSCWLVPTIKVENTYQH